MKIFMQPMLAIALCAVTLSPGAKAESPEQDALQETVRIYCDAWGEEEPSRRAALLERSWAQTGSYIDPLAQVQGRNELSDHIGKFQKDFPKARIVVSSKVDPHHGRFRFSWKMVVADGSTALEGIDFGEIDNAGRIARIVGFFGPLKPLP